MKKLALALITILFFSSTVISQIPQTMSFQGSLVDPTSGDPLPDDQYNLSFELWDAETGGSNVWSEEHPSTQVSSGLFNVILGVGNPANLLGPELFNKALWLEIKVNTESLSPRIELTPSAYSHAR